MRLSAVVSSFFPFPRLPAREGPGKKVGRVAHFLDLDAELVPALGIEALQRLAALGDLAAAARQLLRRQVGERLLAQRSLGAVMTSPGAGFDPAQCLEQQIVEPA
jgi:hypothetical protein